MIISGNLKRAKNMMQGKCMVSADWILYVFGFNRSNLVCGCLLCSSSMGGVPVVLIVYIAHEYLIEQVKFVD